ncbi:MAG: transporter substrate-binding domain-containing protein [Rhodospirillaceae bacterium]|nr:transporter substrate-binding domain-containing protein [Rhodospirillaceae bacterium]
MGLVTTLKTWIPLIAAAAIITGSPGQRAFGQTVVEKIKARGFVLCGASQGVPGLSRPDENGIWRGFDSDICRSFASAILGDRDKIRFVPLNAAQRLPALQTGEIDILSRTTTLTYTRDTAIRFVILTLYDNDALLVRKDLQIKQKKDLDGLTVCLQGGGSLTEQAIAELEESESIEMKKVYFDSTIQARDAYFANRCDTYVTDGIAATAQRLTVAQNPDDHEQIVIAAGAEPNGIAIARGDDQLFDVARWTVNALLWAEAKGITQSNVDEFANGDDSFMRRILGTTTGIGKPIGLDDKWIYNVIKQNGNYAEIWDRNIGAGSPLKVKRGMNALYRDGGVHFPFPWE